LCIKHNRRIGRIILAALLPLIVAYALGETPDDSTTRIVSLVPGLTETCFAIGAGNQVVGVSDYCMYPAEAQKRPRVGGLGNPRLEQLLLLRPTIVLLYRSQADFAARLETLHVQSRLYAVDRINDIYQATDELGSLTGKREAAAGLIRSMRETFDQMRARHSQTTSSRAIVLVSRDPTELRNLFQAGPQNFLGEILEIAGGTHAISSSAAITKEQIIVANPQVILDFSAGETASSPAVQRIGKTLWESLNTVDAVRNHRVHILADPHTLVPGPYLTHVASDFEKLLHF
jgi:iron complex transport system substrate-binding protein